MSADVAIVIGHHPDEEGAGMTVEGRTIQEYDFFDAFADALRAGLGGYGIKADVVTRPNKRPDQALMRRIRDTGADCGIELHYNAAATEEAHGTEMLYAPDSGGRELAEALQELTVRALGTESRGVKERTDLYVLRHAEIPFVVTEPAFGTNAEDTWKLLTKQCDLLCAYRSALVDFVQGGGV